MAIRHDSLFSRRWNGYGHAQDIDARGCFLRRRVGGSCAFPGAGTGSGAVPSFNEAACSILRHPGQEAGSFRSGADHPADASPRRGRYRPGIAVSGEGVEGPTFRGHTIRPQFFPPADEARQSGPAHPCESPNQARVIFRGAGLAPASGATGRQLATAQTIHTMYR